MPYHLINLDNIGFYLNGLFEADGNLEGNTLRIFFNRTELISAENLVKFFPDGCVCFVDSEIGRKTDFTLTTQHMLPFLVRSN